jgi:hypothetical protein
MRRHGDGASDVTEEDAAQAAASQTDASLLDGRRAILNLNLTDGA